MIRHQILYSLSFILALTGCAGTIKHAKGTPDWIYGQAKEYPDMQYISSRGQGMSLELAEDRARADLAKNYEVAIREISHDGQAYTRKMDEAEKKKYSTYVERDIVTHTSGVLRDVAIAEIWFDPAEEIYYALAVLSRQMTAMRLRQEMEVLDNTTAIYLSVPHGTDDKLLEVAMIQKSIEAQWERTSLQHSFSVVNPSSHGVPPSWDVVGMEVIYHKLLGKISFQVKAKGSKDLENIIASSLAASGFMVKDDKPADYHLIGTLELDDIKRDNGLYWLRGNLTISLKDPGGQLRGSHTWPLKQSATQEAVVKQQINLAVEHRLKEDLRLTLLGFAYNK